MPGSVRGCPGDDEYLALADHGISLAQAQLQKSDSAEMHLYAGMGLALKAKLYGLREERRATAHAGVDAREQFLRATQLDPDLADAYTGLGLYNYYADALSGVAKMLRFFMGIPGGSKKEGIKQLEIGMNRGELIAPEARFYYARNFAPTIKNTKRRWQSCFRWCSATRTIRFFCCMAGNLNAELGRKRKSRGEVSARPNKCPFAIRPARSEFARLRKFLSSRAVKFLNYLSICVNQFRADSSCSKA